MLFVKYLLITGAFGLFVSAAAILILDLYRAFRSPEAAAPVRWRLAVRLAALGWLPLLPALSIVVVPSGMAGVRVSQISGTLGGTLYPGTAFRRAARAARRALQRSRSDLQHRCVGAGEGRRAPARHCRC